jgi:hypothetical protein
MIEFALRPSSRIWPRSGRKSIHWFVEGRGQAWRLSYGRAEIAATLHGDLSTILEWAA